MGGSRPPAWSRKGNDRIDALICLTSSAGKDVGEAILVHELLDEGVAHRRIRRAIHTLRERHGNTWPLQGTELATDGHDVLALEDEAAWDIGNRVWQQKIGSENLRQIAGLLRRGGWAARTLPGLSHIEVNPDRLSGRPTIVGRRVPVEVVAQIAEEPGGVDELHEGFDLSDAEINDARQSWHAVPEYAEAA